MITATVVYLADAATVGRDFDEAQALERLGFADRWSLVAASDNGFYDMHDAVRILVERGAHRVEARRGSLDEEGNISLFGEPLRILG
jgi:hypothetical protein